MATFNLVFDESGKGADCTHVVYAGILIEGPGAQVRVWDALSRHWALLLHQAGLTSFKASEAFTFKGQWAKFRGLETERDKLLLSLAALANEYPREVSAVRITVADFKAMSQERRERYRNDPFYCAFEQGILHAVRESRSVLPTDNFNLICDDSEGEAAECLKVFRRFRQLHPNESKRIGTICFGDDEKILPLQMADMFGYVLRKESQNAPDGVWRKVLRTFMPDEQQIISNNVIIR